MSTMDDLKRIAEIEFADIVKETFFIGYKAVIIFCSLSHNHLNCMADLT